MMTVTVMCTNCPSVSKACVIFTVRGMRVALSGEQLRNPSVFLERAAMRPMAFQYGTEDLCIKITGYRLLGGDERVRLNIPPSLPTHGRPTHYYRSTWYSTSSTCSSGTLITQFKEFVLGFPFFMISHHNGDRPSPSPGGLLSTPPARQVGSWRPIFRQRHLVLPCGAGVAGSRSRGGQGTGSSNFARRKPKSKESGPHSALELLSFMRIFHCL